MFTMRLKTIFLLIACSLTGLRAAAQSPLEQKVAQLPTASFPLPKADFDWLIDPSRAQAAVLATPDGKGIILTNGLVARELRVVPNLATVELYNLMTGESMLRAVGGEGSLTIDGIRWPLGGLEGQSERGFLRREWLDELRSPTDAFVVTDFELSDAPIEVPWAHSRWSLNQRQPTGKRATFTLVGAGSVQVKIHYTIYDRIPVVRKSFEVINRGDRAVNLDRFELEQLAFADIESPGGGDPSKFRLPSIHVESDYACGGSFTEMESEITERWLPDTAYTSQRNYLLQTPCLLQVAPPLGPDATIAPGDTFASFGTLLMPLDSDDRERKGLFLRRMHYTLAPWATENPIFLHLTSSDPQVVRRAIDQCDSVGYEMVILSFGSGLNAEDTTATNIAKFKTLVEYATARGVELGCYSLLSSRWISEQVDVVNPATGKRGGMRFGSAPCLASAWGYSYFDKIRTFIERTGMRCFEHDGSYPGDVCASTQHAHHKGLQDSQWAQFQKIRALYRDLCARGVYLNVPDFYFLNGSTKTSIGYRETNWSLPRASQIIHARQLNYDGTWDRMASACWSFLPLVEYHGGGAEATLEPLSEHLTEYRTHMIQNYGAGIQACYRGARLYDTPETKAVVGQVVEWYKKHREILNSDIIHLRRPDARDWDGLLHVNPHTAERGLALFFNPTDQPITRAVTLPLYYTGLTQQATIRWQNGRTTKHRLARDYSVQLSIEIPAHGTTWFVIE